MISVIIPIYQVEKYLNECIESVVNQSYRDLEIILVDDGSLDASPAICDKWAESDTRIQVLHKENGGLSDARNAGINIAKGDYIGFVDSDDWITPNMYEILMQNMLETQSDISVCGVEIFWEDGRHGVLTNEECAVFDNQKAMLELIEEKGLKQPVWNKLYKKNVVEGIFFKKGKSHEDVFWSYQVISRAKRVCVVDSLCYHYRQRSDSIMGTDYSLRRLDAIEAKCERQNFLIEKYPEIQSRGLIDLWFSCLYQGQKALQYLPKCDQDKAFSYLKQVLKQYPISLNDITVLKKSHQMWLLLTKISIKFSCKARNIANVGK